MKKGNIIFLNGVSSAGKSTLARALQTQLMERVAEPYFIIKVDTFMNFAPIQKHPKCTPRLNAIYGMHHAIKSFSDLGYHVIVDHVLLTINDTMEHAVKLLHDYPVLFVHVTCPPEELERREKTRGNRKIGLSKRQLPQLNPQNTYDLTVDTLANTTAESVDKIINCPPSRNHAFKSLYTALDL